MYSPFIAIPKKIFLEPFDDSLEKASFWRGWPQQK